MRKTKKQNPLVYVGGTAEGIAVVDTVGNTITDVGGTAACPGIIYREPFEEGGDYSVMVYGGLKRMDGQELDGVGTPVNVGGTLTYRAEKDGPDDVVHGDSLGKGYVSATALGPVAGVDDKPACVAFDGEKYLLVHDGQEIVPEHADVGPPGEVNGHLS